MPPSALPPDVGPEFQKFPAPQPTLLTVYLTNITAYYQDTVDLTALATLPQATINTANLMKNNFFPLEVIADIAQINGDAVKGLYLSKNLVTKSGHDPSGTTAPQGTVISDASITGFRHDIFKILNQDDTAIGSIMAAGVSGQPFAPGGPPKIQGGDWAIIGGTGVYLGASGQMGGQGGAGGGGGTIRATSVREDPSLRRSLAGPSNFTTIYLYVIPMIRPQIISVFHAAVGNEPPKPVTHDHPAKAGDHLILYATGLGPVTPNVPVGEAFPPNPQSTVISPVTVTIGSTVIPIATGSAQGVPGYTNGYSVGFTVPTGIPPGETSIQVTSAWIPSAPSTIHMH